MDQRETPLLAAYEMLGSGYASTTALQWQVPAFGIAGQAAILIAITTTTSVGVRIALGAASFVIALAVTAVTRRAELTAAWDRAMLDRYEQLLLDDSLRLHHSGNLHLRLAEQPFRLVRGPLPERFELGALRFAPPSLILCITMVVLATVSIVVAAVGAR
jgi:hypothetical protein